MGLFTKIKNAFHCLKEEYEDPVFGKLWRKGKGMWIGEVPFQQPPTRATRMSVLIDSVGGKPTDDQRELFRHIMSRYPQLWPTIAKALAENHPDLKTIEGVTQHVNEPCLWLDPIHEGQPRRWSIDYTFDLETEGDMGYTAEFIEWELTDISAGD